MAEPAGVAVEAVDEQRIRFDISTDHTCHERRLQRQAGWSKVGVFVSVLAVAGIAAAIIGARTDHGNVFGAGIDAIAIALAIAHEMRPERPSRVRMIVDAASRVKAVACPSCGAPAGERCSLPALDTRVCHSERGGLYYREYDRVLAQAHG